MWSVDPATAGPQHIDDPADHPTIVHPRLASRVRRQMRLDLRKLIVRQPEMVPIHQRFLSEAVNHMPDIMPTTLWVRTLVNVGVLLALTETGEETRPRVLLVDWDLEAPGLDMYFELLDHTNKTSNYL